jgi:hypothetical protein
MDNFTVNVSKFILDCVNVPKSVPTWPCWGNNLKNYNIKNINCYIISHIKVINIIWFLIVATVGESSPYLRKKEGLCIRIKFS